MTIEEALMFMKNIGIRETFDMLSLDTSDIQSKYYFDNMPDCGTCQLSNSTEFAALVNSKNILTIGEYDDIVEDCETFDTFEDYFEHLQHQFSNSYKNRKSYYIHYPFGWQHTKNQTEYHINRMINYFIKDKYGSFSDFLAAMIDFIMYNWSVNEYFCIEYVDISNFVTVCYSKENSVYRLFDIELNNELNLPTATVCRLSVTMYDDGIVFFGEDNRTDPHDTSTILINRSNDYLYIDGVEEFVDMLHSWSYRYIINKTIE